MKLLNTLLIWLLLGLGSSGLTAQNVVIPDPLFKASLLSDPAINTNGDTEIQVAEATAFTGTMNCSGTQLHNVIGIEAFVNMTGLICSSNPSLLTLDLSQNVNLEMVNCSFNYLMYNLNVSQLVNLRSLTFRSTEINGIGLGNNVNLTYLDCSGNNYFRFLNVSQNVNLEHLNCSGTLLTSLDLSNNPNLEYLNCQYNDITSLDMRNGNNTIITTFDVNFGSLNCIEVDDVGYSIINWTNIDPGTTFNTDCNGPPAALYIPDPNFRAYLVGNTAINTNGDTSIQYSEATSFNGTMNCSYNGIADLSGIGFFVNLNQLKCNNNNLTSLDVSQNTGLTQILCYNNQIDSLDVTQNTNLVILHCVNNLLTALDVTQNPNLVTLYCASNSISSLDLSQNGVFRILDCDGNQLSALNIKNGNNTNVTTFSATGNALTCIEVDDVSYSSTTWLDIDAGAAFSINCGPGPAVTIPDANFKAYLVGNTAINTNGDLEIQVAEAVAFSGTINCSSLSITDLTGIEAFVNLTGLDCSTNNLRNLDVTLNTSLTSLDCAANQLRDLTVKNGNNANVTNFSALNNPALTCIEVDNATYSSTNWLNIDATASFNISCAPLPIVNIPDANFKAYLVANTAINTSGDAEIQVIEAAAFTGLMDCSSLSIADLTGIEAFVNLTALDCSTNSLTSLDVTLNTSLTSLDCSTNSLTSLDITLNTSLTSLDCSTNSLTSLDITLNTSLTDLVCNNNSISSLDLSQNTNLTSLDCSTNSLTSLDVAANTSLTTLSCSSTPISSLDLTQNTSLIALDCSATFLGDLNLKNGNNTTITTFDASNNPNLLCIEVDDSLYSTTNWLNIDPTSTFSVSCGPAAPVVYIPDANFKAYLVANTAINTNGDFEIQVTEATAFSGTMNCSNNSIADLTGIEAFVNLNQLRCYRNDLTTLDLTYNINLTQVYCYNNLLTSLNLTQNASLVVLHTVGNSLTNIDLTQNTNLATLYCANNSIYNLDLSQNASLRVFNCDGNQMQHLNIKNGNNANVTTFSATGNSLACIEVDDAVYSSTNWTNIDTGASFNTNCGLTAVGPFVYIADPNFKTCLLANAAVNTNGDTAIQVSEAIAVTGALACTSLGIHNLVGIEAFVNLQSFDCTDNLISAIDVSQNTSLSVLKCADNTISTLDVSQNTNLVTLDCDNNRISALDLSQNTNLELVRCVDNQISTLDVSQNNLTDLICYNNQISALSLTQSTNLTSLFCTNNLLSTLDLSQNVLLYNIIVSGNQLSALDLSANVAVQYFHCTHNNLTTLDLTQNTSLYDVVCTDNDLTSVDLRFGNGGAPNFFMATNNPNLSCVSVNNINYSINNYTVDTTTSFSFNCVTVAPVVTIPDANFKAYLVANTAINTNGDTEIQVSEATAFTDSIICSSLSLYDLTGIEAFVNLTYLDCFDNYLTSLDLRQNTSLTTLYVSLNQLTYLNVKNGNNSNFVYFDARTNPNLTCIEVDNALYSTTNWGNIGTGVSFNTNCTTVLNVHIPDVNFKAYLVGNTAINTNGDTEIQFTEAAAFTGRVDCHSMNVADLTGIEAFVNITELHCNVNGLTSLDLSQNTNLTWVRANNNSLTSLDVTQNTSLVTLNLYANNLSSLDVSQNTNLTYLHCGFNPPLTSLDVTQNINLLTLVCGDNNLSSLDVSQNTVLEILSCGYSPLLTSLDVSQNTNLINLSCTTTPITSLDLSLNTSLTDLDCSSCSLTSLNVKNGNNTNVNDFYAFNNSALTCIDVDSVLYSSTNWQDVDPIASFSTNCNPVSAIVYIPDVNFKAYLVGNTGINTNGDTEIQVTEATAFTGVINCPNWNISDATGVEAFVNLRELICYNNNLSSLDLTQNTSLLVLHCVNNSITSLDLTQNTNLSWLYASTNQLHRLDVTQNTNLTKLYCNSNQITSLDLSQNTNLVVFDASSNALSSLDIKNGRNAIVSMFKVTSNPNLICIQVDDAAYSAMHWMDLDTTASFSNVCAAATPVVHIPDANFKAYLVGDAIINRNGDAEIQVSEALLFTGIINCPNLSITDLTGVEAFVNLTGLYCYSNPITSLDVSQNTNLTELYCHRTQLTTLDVTQNTSLIVLNCSSAQLSNLNVKNGNNANFTTFKAVNNFSLSCIEVDNVLYSTANWVNIDVGVSFSTSCALVAPIVNIPEVNFKAYLVGNTAINTNGDTEIQVSEAAAFTGAIICSSLSLYDLTGIEAFVNLTYLDCFDNYLTSLDLSQNTSLTTLYVSLNQLTYLNVKNGNNSNFVYFDARTNPNLSCIEVDDAGYSTANWTGISATTSFSVACGAPIVNIPDANFKAHLLGNTAINTNSDSEIQVSEARAFSGTINCSNSSIADLTGVEAFVNLTQLKCYGNLLTSLDVSQNTSLVVLHCVHNSLTSLDVTANTSLSWLYCSRNQLSSLDLSQNTSLTKLYCGSNQLGSLDVRNGNNSIITTFNTTNNANLTCIDVDDVAYSTVTWTDIDAGVATFSTNCTIPRVANHSDVRFETNLVKHTANHLNNLEATKHPIHLSVYPNPATREIRIDFGKTYEEATIQITNLTGHIVKSKYIENSASVNLNLEGPTGIYFVHIQTEAGSATLKVIKE